MDELGAKLDGDGGRCAPGKIDILGMRPPAVRPPSRLLLSIDYTFRKFDILTLARDKMDGSAAQSIYRAEKARAMQERRISHAQLMAEAKEAFNKMLADAQLARKGGRPRTNPVPVAAAAAAPTVAKPKPSPTTATKPVRQAQSPKAAPAKKAPAGKKLRAAAKRAAPARAKTKASAKRGSASAKKGSSNARTSRTSRPTHRSRQVTKKR